MPQFQTHAEATNFQETSCYPEALEYCAALSKASDWVKYQTFGVSPEGRDLPSLIVSKDRIFTPEEAHRSDRVIVLVLNGIHPGEIAGKEATFALLREIAITKLKADLLDRMILLVVPIYNVDGHERFGPFNRVNQNGPKQMGWRTNSRNRNLNRDWIKAEETETQALLKIYTSWLPHFMIDNHVSDGADFQYDLTYILDDNIRVAPPLLNYLKKNFEPRIHSWMESTGHVIAPYFESRDTTDPAGGLNIGPTTARFSNGYGTLQNRPTITVETHMLKSFEVRIKAHYDFMEAILRAFSAEGDSFRKAIAESDTLTAQLKGEYPIRLELDETRSEQFVFKGVEYAREMSEISGTTKVRYGIKPIKLTVPFYKTLRAARNSAIPLGYIIPAQWEFAIECLQHHKIEFGRLKNPVSGEFETYRFTDVSWEHEPFEGHHIAHFKTTRVTETRSFQTGSAVVWLNQRSNKVILELLEPDAADSLVSWGYFNAIFEDKEYAEAFILEELATKMIADTPALAQEFNARLEKDDAFRNDPVARLKYFYERSPFRDQRKNAYPIARITAPSQIPS